MDTCFGLLVLVGLVAWPIIVITSKIQKAKEEAERQAAAAKAEADLQRDHPELWGQKEMLKLEKERLAIAKQLAEQQAKEENTRENIGLGWALGRSMGWW